MAYNCNNKRSNFNNRGTRPVMKVLPMVVNNVDNKGRQINVDSCFNLVKEFQDFNLFDKLSVDVTMSKKIYFDNPDAKGVISIARVQSFNPETCELNIMLFGKNVDNAEKITSNMIIVPRVRIGHDSSDVVTILGFEIVNC